MDPRQPKSKDPPSLDLDLPGAPTAATPKATAVDAPLRVAKTQVDGTRGAANEAGTPGLDLFGAGTFDADHFGDGASSVALADSDPGTIGGGDNSHLDMFGSGTFDGDDLDSFDQGNVLPASATEHLDQAGLSPSPSIKTVEASNWPTGTTRRSEDLIIDEVEIRVAADYGTPPAAAPLAPLYTLRVWSRQRELRSIARVAAERQAQAELERDALLSALALELRPRLEQDDHLAAMLGPVKELEELARERSGVLASVKSEYDEKVDILAQDLKRIEKERAAIQATMPRLKEEFDERSDVFRREDARLKRVFIEIRAANQVADRAREQTGSFPDDHESTLAKLQAQADQLAPGVEALKTAVVAAQAPITEIEQNLKALAKEEGNIAAQRAELDRAFDKQAGVRAEGVEEAEQKLRKCLADVGRGVLAAKGRIAVEDAHLDQLRAADKKVAAAAVQSETIVRSIDSYDQKLFNLGKTITMAVAAGLVIIIVLVIAL